MWDKRDDMVVHERDPYNAEPPRHALNGHPVTPTDAFYVRNHGAVPRIDAREWRLVVDGLVGDALRLSLEDLRGRFGQRTTVATLQCAGNRRTGLLAVRDIPGEAPWGGCATATATWTGVALSEVLACAGVDDAAAHVAFEAPDVALDAEPRQPFGGSIPVEKALAGEVLLAWDMNDEPLTAVHGAPVRVVVPGYIGARSVKWVERVTVQREPSENYFQSTVYRLLPDGETAAPGVGLSLGSVALNTEILRPDDGCRVPPGPAEVSGYAYAGDDRGVARVDVSLDGGTTWLQADLDPPQGRWAWQLWRVILDLPPGQARITARAWDTTGATQPARPEHVWNPKGYVNNSWADVSVTVG